MQERLVPVYTTDQFLEAIHNAQEYDRILIRRDLDLRDIENVRIDTAYVSIEGDRDGRSTLWSSFMKETKRSQISVRAKFVRIAHVTLDGDVFDGEDGEYQGLVGTQSNGILVKGRNVRAEIVNCVLQGWPGSAIRVNEVAKATVRESVIRDCVVSGEGYGIEVHGGTADIHGNTLENCRHMVMGHGDVRSVYRAYQNKIVVTRRGARAVFDMHAVGGLAREWWRGLNLNGPVPAHSGTQGSGSWGNAAGHRVEIINNEVVAYDAQAVGENRKAFTSLRGTPGDQFVIRGNKLKEPMECCIHKGVPTDKVTCINNTYA